MRSLPVLLAAVALSFAVGSCGSTGKDARVASSPSSTFSKTTTAPSRADVAAAKDITEYGQEASSADRHAITALVKRYYAAAAADDGATACALIYSPLSESVAEDYGQAPGPASLQGRTCQVVMSKFFRQVPGQPAAVLATTEVTGVRVKGRRGFALLRSKAVPEGDIPVERELGTWKIGTLIGDPLPGSPSPPPASAGSGKTSPPNYDAPGAPQVKDANDGDDDRGSNDDEQVIDFGHAASAADQKAITILIKSFYAATGTANGSAICSLLYDVLAEVIPENYEQSPGLKGHTCSEVMGKVFASRRREMARDARKVKVTRVRVEGPKGIAMVYLGKHPEPYFLVHRQGTEWKMQTISTTILP
jgi:hypothetical protein